MDLVLKSLDGGVGTITIHNPARRNCICVKLVGELVEAFDSLEREGARVVVLRAQPGVKTWSAGHDINELPVHGRDPLDFEDSLETILRKVQAYPLPIIALVEGGVWGGACDLMISCDIVVCSQEATFAITPAKLGLPYNPSGLVHFIHTVGPHKAKEMLYTARPITADEAFNARLVNYKADTPAAAEEHAFALARAIADNAPMAVRVLKRQFRMLLAGQMLPAEIFEMIQAMRRAVYESEDYLEGIRAFKEKRRPAFKGK